MCHTFEVYEEAHPERVASYTRQMATGKAWRFHHWTYRGNVYLDAYIEWSLTQRGVFGYDALDRLTTAAVTGGGEGLYNRTYAYNPIGNLTSKTGLGAYTYGTPGHSGCTAGTPATKPHAVTAVTNRDFLYDCNGNMRSRDVSTVQGDLIITLTYNLTYNAENRLYQYKQGSTVQATYTYDADGTLVKKVVGGTTTIYVGQHYEKTGSTVTKYYYLGGQRVAMRQGSTVYYLHGDHLGSASLVSTSNGGVHSEMRYYPYAGRADSPKTRWSSGMLPTDRRYTGQRYDSYTQLYHMGARWYDPVLARWTSADSIIPDPANPQSLNRYAYVYNNALRYTDPNGHAPVPPQGPGGFAGWAWDAWGLRIEGTVAPLSKLGDKLLMFALRAGQAEPSPVVEALGAAAFALSKTAIDFNVDLIVNPTPATPDDVFSIMFTGNVGLFTEGGSLTAGPILLWGLESSEQLVGKQLEVGGTVVVPKWLGIEIAYGYSPPSSEGEDGVQLLYISPGINSGTLEVSFYEQIGYSVELTDYAFRLAEILAQKYNELTQQE